MSVDRKIEQKLDEIMASRALQRKVSETKTPECPVWSPLDQLWIESDENLRRRLKQEIEAKAWPK